MSHFPLKNEKKLKNYNKLLPAKSNWDRVCVLDKMFIYFNFPLHLCNILYLLQIFSYMLLYLTFESVFNFTLNLEACVICFEIFSFEIYPIIIFSVHCADNRWFQTLAGLPQTKISTRQKELVTV